jgi:hypothetical protein
VGAAVVLMNTVAPGAFDQDPLMRGVVCYYADDPDDTYTSGNCPPTVIAPQRSDSAKVTVEVVNGYPGWIEGGYFFVRATSPDGQVVLEKRLDTVTDEADPPPRWATGEEYLPPGSYEFTVYGRSCDANCGFLDPASYVCAFPITAAANEQLTIDYDWNDCAES